MRIFRVRVIFAPQEKNHELCYDRYNLLYKIDRFYSEGVVVLKMRTLCTISINRAI
jgi:hypothetical protein